MSERTQKRTIATRDAGSTDPLRYRGPGPWGRLCRLSAVVVMSMGLFAGCALLEPKPTAAPVAVLPGPPEVLNIEVDGKTLQVDDQDGCAVLENPYIARWCRMVLAEGVIALPKDTQTMTSADSPNIIAAFGRALLADDYIVCDDPVVAKWVEIGGHTTQGARACRESLTTQHGAGRFSVTDPTSGETVWIAIP